MPRLRARSFALLFSLPSLALVWASAAGAASADFEASLAPPQRLVWAQGLEFERQELLLESSQCYESIAEALPGSAFIRWRLSRNYWRHGERLPVDAKKERIRYFDLSEHWTDEALAIDPECGECIMWKIASKGRLATTGGMVTAAASAAEIAEWIDRGIALHPVYADNASNATLGNLYYAGSAFYRIVPDWFWLRWVIGVRGDKQRALDYIQKALEISSDRIDYRVELGAVLLCIGGENHDPERLAQGSEILRSAMELEFFQSTDRADVEHAQIMLAEPEKACGYSRDGWIDLRRAQKRRQS